MQSDALAREELERLLESRQFGRDLSELLEPERPDPAGGDAVAHFE